MAESCPEKLKNHCWSSSSTPPPTASQERGEEGGVGSPVLAKSVQVETICLLTSRSESAMLEVINCWNSVQRVTVQDVVSVEQRIPQIEEIVSVAHPEVGHSHDVSVGVLASVGQNVGEQFGSS